MAGAAAVIAAGHGGPAAKRHGAAPGAGMRDEGFGYETMFMVHGRIGLEAGRRRDPRLPRVGRRIRPRRGRCAGRSRSTSTTSARTRCWPTPSAWAPSRRSASRTSTPRRRDVRETRAAAFAGATTRAPGAGRAGAPRTAHDWRRPGRRTGRPAPPTRAPTRRRSPSSRSPRAKASPRSSGTSASPASCYGGQTANPSTGELLEAVKSVDAHEVLAAPEQPERGPRRAPGLGR